MSKQVGRKKWGGCGVVHLVAAAGATLVAVVVAVGDEYVGGGRDGRSRTYPHVQRCLLKPHSKCNVNHGKQVPQPRFMQPAHHPATPDRPWQVCEGVRIPAARLWHHVRGKLSDAGSRFRVGDMKGRIRASTGKPTFKMVTVSLIWSVHMVHSVAAQCMRRYV